MSIVKMKHLRLVAMQQDRQELLRLLQRMGCVEIDEPHTPDGEGLPEGLRVPDTGDLARARECSSEAERALGVLDRWAPEKGGLFRTRIPLEEGVLYDADRLERANQAVQQVLEAERTVTALQAGLARLGEERSALQPWLSLDVPLETQATRYMQVQFGTLPVSADPGQVEGQLLAQTPLVRVVWAQADRERRYLLLMYHRSAAQEVEQTIKQLGWSRANLRSWQGTAQDNDLRLARQQEQIRVQLDERIAQLKEMAALRPEVQLAADRAGVDVCREESRSRLLDTGTAFVLEGWLPAASAQELTRALEPFACAVELSDPRPEQYPQVPIKLKNGLLSRCMNVVTEMYSMPAYDGIDPNPFMFPFFVLFFGIMMADMGYGLLMIAAALFVLFKTKPREGTRNFMEGVLWCGISTFIVGALSGGFFGDLIPQMARIIDPDSTLTLPALFTPLDDTMAIMIGSVAVGCVQIVTGMTISVVHKIRQGDFLDALFDEITWWIILGGTALAIFGIGTVSGVPVVLVVGVLMLVFGGTRKAKGFGKLSSLVGLVYNGVTGFFSDALSYVRLMALMLSGSVIASVFNTLGATFGNVFLFFIVAMIGNALNLALNLLGCYVHDLRLQCLEFFNRFYKEGGRPYAPLSYQTKYTDIIKEEM